MSVDTRPVKLAAFGKAQAIRIPKAFEFVNVDHVYVTQDPATGDLIVSARAPVTESPLETLFRAIDALEGRDRIAAEAGAR